MLGSVLGSVLGIALGTFAAVVARFGLDIGYWAVKRGVYAAFLRRIQIHLDNLVDDRLAIEARRRGVSKAALIRQLISQASEHPAQDPVDAVIGAGDGEPVGDIDAAVYGR